MSIHQINPQEMAQMQKPMTKLFRSYCECPQCNGMMTFKEIGWSCDNCGTYMSGVINGFDSQLAYGLCMRK